MTPGTTVPSATVPSAAVVPALDLRQVTRVYPTGRTALVQASLTLPTGSFLAVMGPSGSGKSTLLQCASGLDALTSGSVRVAGTDITRFREAVRTRFRRDHIGFVFQSYNLIPALSVEQNITLPARLARTAPDRPWMRELAHRLDLTDLLHRMPAELSGGQQQRVAIARAVATRPAVLFADEPTGALDLRASAVVLDLLRALVDDLGQTVVMVTHNPAAAAYADHAIVMADGRIVDRLDAPSAHALAQRLTAVPA